MCNQLVPTIYHHIMALRNIADKIDDGVLWGMIEDDNVSENDRAIMTFNPWPWKNVSMSLSYFRLYQLSLKLMKLMEISCRDQRIAFECVDIGFYENMMKIMDVVCPKDFVVKWKRQIYQSQNVEAILDDAQEVQEHLDKVRLASREKAVVALAKALPFPREVLYVLLDKIVEVQEENLDEEEAWKIEEVTESEKLDGHGLDGQNFLDLYIAMTEIYEGLKRFRSFWPIFMEAYHRVEWIIEANEEAELSSTFEWETDDEWDD